MMSDVNYIIFIDKLIMPVREKISNQVFPVVTHLGKGITSPGLKLGSRQGPQTR